MKIIITEDKLDKIHKVIEDRVFYYIILGDKKVENENRFFNWILFIKPIFLNKFLYIN
jgi:hypothetical protein